MSAPASSTDPTRERRLSVRAAAGIALGLGLLVRLLVLAGGRDLVPDGVVDLEMARDLLHGRWDDAILRRYHPLPGALEAVLARAAGREPDETIGLLVSLAAGALVPFFVALAAARIFELARSRGSPEGRTAAGRVALAAGVLAAAHPYLARAAATVWAYPLAHAALAGALAAAARAAATGRASAFALAGFACGLAYLARPDGLVVFLGVALGLTVLAGSASLAPAAERAGFPRRPLAGRAAALALVTAGFLVPASPYILALHDAVSRTDPSGGTWRLTLKKHERHLVGIPDPNPREQVAPVASDLATLLAPPARASAEVGTASAVLVAARKTADAVHPLIIVLGALGLAWCLGARLAHAPALATLGAFFCAHVLLRRNEGYLSKEHAAGEAAIVLAWAGAGAIALADRGATLLRSSRARSLAPAAVVLLGLAVLLPKTLERREAVKNDAERAVARAIAARWATVQEREPSRELLLCGNEAHVRSVAFLAGGRLVDLPRGDAAQVVSSARARGVSFLVLHARSHDDAARDRLLAAREALARAGLSSPLAFEGSRPDPEGGSVVYTWLLYELPRRSP